MLNEWRVPSSTLKELRENWRRRNLINDVVSLVKKRCFLQTFIIVFFFVFLFSIFVNLDLSQLLLVQTFPLVFLPLVSDCLLLRNYAEVWGRGFYFYACAEEWTNRCVFLTWRWRYKLIIVDVLTWSKSLMWRKHPCLFMMVLFIHNNFSE